MTNSPNARANRMTVPCPHRLRLLPLLAALALGGCATQEFVQKEVGQYDARVQGLEAWFKAVNQGLDNHARRILEAEGRIGAAEQSGTALAARLDATRNDLAGTHQRTERLAGDLAGANQRLDAAGAEAARAHQRLDGLDGRLDATRRRVEGTVAKLAMAEGRIGALEAGLGAQGRAMDAFRSASGADPTVPAAPAPVQAPPAPLGPAQPVAAEQPAPALAAPVPATPDGTAAQLAEMNRRMDQQNGALATTSERLAGLEARLAGLGGQDQALDAALAETRRQLAELQSELLRLRAQGEANAEALARVDRRVGGMQADLDSARQRVEAGEKVLAESGLRLTLVQELVNTQGERLARTEVEAGKLSGTAREALERALQAGKLAEGKLVFEATLTDEVTNFAFEDARLNEAARSQLIEFADRLKAENRGAFIEIQGHTDSVGPEEANLRLSRERATAVRDFLHREAGIPLHLLAVAAYGETRPVADNGTREGRAKNRRVVLVVLR